jgi:hypothetical protein
MANVKNVNRVELYREKNSIDVRLVAVQHLSHLKREYLILRASAHLSGNSESEAIALLESVEPNYAGLACML